MKNQFKIGEVSKILGVSTDTLRLYDNSGILTPKKDNDNGYRYYSCSDIICLDYIIHLRKMDMSLKNIDKLINHSDINKEKSEMEIQESLIVERIKELNGLLDSVREYRRDLEKIESNLNIFEVRESPQIIAMDLDNTDDCAIKRFTEIMGTRMPYFAFLYDNIRPLKLGYSQLLLDESERLKIYKHRRILIDHDGRYNKSNIRCEGIEIIPPKKCINVVVKSSANKDYSCIDMIGEYCIKNNIHPVGESIVRVITVRRAENQGSDYYDVWIPIE